jgi:ABC-type glycerol-3-phosphate transport system permease component
MNANMPRYTSQYHNYYTDLIFALLRFGFLAIVAIITILPFLWLVSTALKTQSEVFRMPLMLISPEPQWQNFSEAWARAPFTRYYLNTLFIAIATTVFHLFGSAAAGYAFAKFQFWGKRYLFILLLAFLMIPPQVTLIPTFLVVKALGWVNTYQGIIFPGLVNVFGIFLMRQYFQSIPDDLIESARIDGCSEWRIFWQIVMPLVTPALAALAIFSFTESWNSFIWPLIVAQSSDMYTIQVGIAFFTDQAGTDFNHLMAVSLIALIPVMLVYVFFQRYFVAGIALTGMK